MACSGTKEERVTAEMVDQEWQSLFNGENFDKWRIKIAKHELDENYNNTFRIEDGMMKVRYDEYDDFNYQYGHIFYDQSFSAYLLHLEYRFVGEQAPGGEGWALRNSGAMLHGQDPRTMGRDQNFPISIEGQLLGGDGIHDRTTSNLCTPGTNVVMDNELFTPHCVSSSSKTYHGEQWVSADFLVLGDSIVHHIVEGDTVLTYFDPQIGGGNVDNFDPSVKKDGQLIKEGFISLQSESHPIDFRTVELFDLAPYMDDHAKLEEVLDLLKTRKTHK
ncbi:3-keto-disaccharide hydrolase [Echinicola salinicaeni]|uniref:3-keto-disaccharide hydrolase n=1 Tax=Echinicola salinicaeni TaxID=2762757 RepID=UPI00374204BC